MAIAEEIRVRLPSPLAYRRPAMPLSKEPEKPAAQKSLPRGMFWIPATVVKPATINNGTATVAGPATLNKGVTKTVGTSPTKNVVGTTTINKGSRTKTARGAVNAEKPGASSRTEPKGVHVDHYPGGSKRRDPSGSKTKKQAGTRKHVRFAAEPMPRVMGTTKFGRYQSLEQEEAEMFPEGEFPQRTPIPEERRDHENTAKERAGGPNKSQQTQSIRRSTIKNLPREVKPKTGQKKSEAPPKSKGPTTPEVAKPKEQKDRRKAIKTITSVIGTDKVPIKQMKELAEALAKFNKKEAPTPAVNRVNETAQGKEQGNKTKRPDHEFDLKTLCVTTYTHRSMAELAEKLKAQKGLAPKWRKITRNIFRCYNCGGAGHMLRKCKKPLRRRFPTGLFNPDEYSQGDLQVLSRKLRAGGLFKLDPETKKKPEQKPETAARNIYGRYTFLAEQENFKTTKKDGEEETPLERGWSPKGMFIGCRSKKDRTLKQKGVGGHADVKETSKEEPEEAAGIEIDANSRRSDNAEKGGNAAMAQSRTDREEAPEEQKKSGTSDVTKAEEMPTPQGISREEPRTQTGTNSADKQDGDAVGTQSITIEEAFTLEAKTTLRAAKTVRGALRSRKINTRRMYASINKTNSGKQGKRLATIQEESYEYSTTGEAEVTSQTKADAQNLEDLKALLDKMLEIEEPVGEVPIILIESEQGTEENAGIKPEEEESLEYSKTTPVNEDVDSREGVMSRFDSNLIVPTPSETVAKQEHTDKITADDTPKSELEREETPKPEPTPEKGYGLSMELVEFEDLNYDDEIFNTPEDQQEQIFGTSQDQDEQTFGQESAKGDNSEVSEEEMPEPESTPESRSRAQLQEWLDALEQITFGSQAGDKEAGNQLRQRLAELEQKVLQEEAEENQAADQGITEDIDPEVEDLVDAQNDKGDNEIAERAQVEVQRRPQASKIVEAPKRLNYIMLPEEVPRTEPVKGKNRKEIDNLFRRLLEEDSEGDDETEEEAEARLIAENNARWERCLEYRRKYCEEYGSNGSDDDEPEPPQDFRGNTTYEDNPSDDEEFYNRNSIWE
ncbi:hypothetical protein B0H16DRAFT_1474600 [Mycena metata]|uniref:CCHC-type domain-containing protein n=1 Tax=Mycena metata TaxID=1033252 RepID=A0AAD7HG46_9AGAR|nr:hypothetical protein B0H16DRAFT_1474600 [Mycena metata]